MKYYLLCLFVFLFISCSKSDSFVNKDDSKVNTDLIDEVLTMQNAGAQKLGYSMLNKEEKFLVWKKHFDGVLRSGVLTKEQAKITNEFKNLLTSDFFDGNQKTDFLSQSYVVELLYKANKIFSKELMVKVFASIDNMNENDAIMSVASPTESAGCTCSTVSNYCTGNNSSCRSGGCIEVSWGCGTLWRYSCDGTCGSLFHNEVDAE